MLTLAQIIANYTANFTNEAGIIYGSPVSQESMDLYTEDQQSIQVNPGINYVDEGNSASTPLILGSFDGDLPPELNGLLNGGTGSGGGDINETDRLAIKDVEEGKSVTIRNDKIVSTTNPDGTVTKGTVEASAFKTAPNTAYFWSGRTDGVGGMDVAAKIAQENGGTTLETVIDKNGVQMPVYNQSNPASVAAWENASAEYAREASGTVRAVIGQNVRPDSIWLTKELPVLKDNPNVTEIIQIDPKTLQEIVIFKR